MFSNDGFSNRSHDKEKDERCNRSLRHKIPYRLLGRRSMGTKRLVLSSKVLLSAIPTHNCEVVLTFPGTTEDSTLMWLLARLKSRKPALTVSVRHHSHSGIYGFYLTADYDSLLQGAEELAILKPLKTEYGGGMKEFAFDDQDCFAGVENEETFLTSQERQSIVLQFLNDLRATGDDTLNGIKFIESQPIVPLLKTKKIISQVFPLHKSNDLKELRQTWVQAVFSPQPLDLVRMYFGVKIALYFAYLGHYTTWLIIPAVFGLLIFLLQGTDQFREDICFLGFALFNVIWASLYLKFWSRASTEFSYRLGMLEKKDDLLKDPRPLFKGELTKSQVTGHLEPTYPAWKRSLFFYTITTPIICMCLLLVFVTMLLCFELQEWVNKLIASSDLPYVLSFGPKILLAVVVSIMDEIYKQIALWLTDKENYRLEETFETNLIIKLVLFQFVNSFLSLFYIGFYLGDMDRLRDQLAALMITRQVLGNVKEALVPYVMWKARLYTFGYRIATKMSPASIEKEVRKMTTKSTQPRKRAGAGRRRSFVGGGKHSDDESSTVSDEEDEGIPNLTQAEVESAMKKYEDTLDDYLEMCIQFGYITLFSSAFPLAALCALVNNVIEIRSDAFKLCLTFQRPFGQRVENIGIWQEVLQYMAIMAVIVNCILMSTTGLLSRLIPGLSLTSSFLLLVVIEHLVITLKLAIARAIPDMPQTISTEMAKLEYQRREALKKLESQATPIQTMASSPSFNRRQPVDTSNKESTASSSSSSLSPASLPSNQIKTSSSVITPSSFPPADNTPVSSTSRTALHSPASFVTSPDMQKPEVPPRTSLFRNKAAEDTGSTTRTNCEAIALSSCSKPTAANIIADKVVSAVVQPVLDNMGSQSQPQSHQPIPRVQLRPRVKPVLNDNDVCENVSESVGRRYLRRRLDLDARRGVSDPVTGAVSMALRLHKDRDGMPNKWGQGSGGRDNDESIGGVSGLSQQNRSLLCDSAETAKERRQDLLRRSLHNMAQREELRRTSSFKHPKKVGEKLFSDSSETLYSPGSSSSSSSSSSSGSSASNASLPPQRVLLIRSKPCGDKNYSSQFLSHKSRSLSSENLSREPSFSWRDRHSWKAEASTTTTTTSPSSSLRKRHDKAAVVGVTQEKELEVPSVVGKEQSQVPGTHPTAVTGKPPSGHTESNKASSLPTSCEEMLMTKPEDVSGSSSSIRCDSSRQTAMELTPNPLSS